MDALAFTSTIAVICVAIFVIACIYLGIVGIMERGVFSFRFVIMFSGTWNGGQRLPVVCRLLSLCSCCASARTSIAPRSLAS